MLYCYFIARSQPEVEQLSFRTLSAASLDFVREQELVAATRRAPPGTRSSPELMLEYNAVLAAASKRATVLPLRFGSSFRNEGAVVRLLAERHMELLRALDRLEGMAEMGLRVRLEGKESAGERVAAINEICAPLDSWCSFKSMFRLARVMAGDERRFRTTRTPAAESRNRRRAFPRLPAPSIGALRKSAIIR